MKKRHIALVLAASLLFTLLSGCFSSEPAESSAVTQSSPVSIDNPNDEATKTDQSGTVESTVVDKVVVGLTSDVPSLAPYYGVSMGGLCTLGYIYEYLFYEGTFGGQLLPMIGKSYTESEDHKTVDVEIFDYVYDSAGNHITVDDVIFSYNTAIASGTINNVVKYIDKIEKTGDWTLRFTLNGGTLSTLNSLLNSTYIVSEAAYDETAFTMKPIGTGAYVVDEFTSGSSLTLSKRDDYWQTNPEYKHPDASGNVEHIEFKIILESAQVAISLETGGIDTATSVSSEDVLNFFIDNDNYNVSTLLSNRYQVLVFSMQNSNVSDDLALRQAILYAIDTNELMYAIVGEYGQQCRTVGYDGGFPDFNPDWYTDDYYDYNVEKARELLEKSNYKANGSPTLRIMLENNADREKIAVLIQSKLRDIGINCEITQYDSALFTTYRYEYDEWDIILDNFAVTDSPLGSHYTRYAANAGLDSGQPYNESTGSRDETLAKLCADASNLDTYSQEVLNAAHEYIKDNAIAYGLFTPMEFRVAQSGITVIGADKKNFLNLSKSVYADYYTSKVK